MLYAAYQFPSEAEAVVALDGVDVASIDAVGNIITHTYGEPDENGRLPILSSETTGWFVNVAWASDEPLSMASFRIPATDAPRWWAGVPREMVTPVLPPPRKLTPLQFMDRLSAQRQAEIAAAATSSPSLLLSLLRLSGATEVDLDNPETIAVVSAMQSAGLISQAEADALLA